MVDKDLFDFWITNFRIRGVETTCLLFESRHNMNIKIDCQAKGYEVYQIRHKSNDWGNPYTIEKHVTVNFWGYIAIQNESVIKLLDKKLDKDGFFTVRRYTLDRFNEESSVYHEQCEIPKALDEYTLTNQGCL